MKKNVFFYLVGIISIFGLIACNNNKERSVDVSERIDWPSNWIGYYKHSDGYYGISIYGNTLQSQTYGRVGRSIQSVPAAPGWWVLNSIDETTFVLLQPGDEWKPIAGIAGSITYTINTVSEGGNIQSFTIIHMGERFIGFLSPGTYMRIE